MELMEILEILVELLEPQVINYYICVWKIYKNSCLMKKIKFMEMIRRREIRRRLQAKRASQAASNIYRPSTDSSDLESAAETALWSIVNPEEPLSPAVVAISPEREAPAAMANNRPTRVAPLILKRMYSKEMWRVTCFNDREPSPAVSSPERTCNRASRAPVKTNRLRGGAEDPESVGPVLDVHSPTQETLDTSHRPRLPIMILKRINLKGEWFVKYIISKNRHRKFSVGNDHFLTSNGPKDKDCSS